MLMHCNNCYHGQLSHAVDPGALYCHYNYVSGTSVTGHAFFESNAREIHDRVGAAGKVLDIACNDGSQLNEFLALGWETYGVDPAVNICPIARAKGHNIVCGFWTSEVAATLPVMRVITAQNVFAHTCNIDDFLYACKSVMDSDTQLYIQTSQRDMLINGEFDTIYHEHISFFTVRSMMALVDRAGLSLHAVRDNPIHGTSYIFEIRLPGADADESVKQREQTEYLSGLYTELSYKGFSHRVDTSIARLKATIRDYGARGYSVVGFGASAKGQTLLSYSRIRPRYIVDESPLKIGLMTPAGDVPIVNVEHLRADTSEKLLVVILAWNFSAEIYSTIARVCAGRTCSVIMGYFPTIQVVSLQPNDIVVKVCQ
jgi:hypothetical protein